jgi:outer membrane lipoprotein-sorting protein
MNARLTRQVFPIALRVLVAAAWMLTVTGSHAADWNVDQLMRGLAKIRSDHAVFKETKYIAMLDKPVESSGELFYSAPDQMEIRTLKPRPESMVIDRDTLVIERDRRKRMLQLQDYPELAAFINGIRGTLAGDRKALERHFRLVLEGGMERWTLQLLPVDEKTGAIITQIRVSGTGDAVQSIEIMRADGDRSLMRIKRLANQ